MQNNKIEELENIFVAGTSGQGKTNFMQSVLCDYLLEYLPTQLKVAIIDLKGVDYFYYDKIPHLYNKEVCISEQSATLLLKEILLELERRKKEFNKVGVDNFTSYNEIVCQDKLCNIVVFIDEIADLYYRENLFDLFKQILKDSNRFGIYFVVSTQLPNLLQNELQNFNYRVACRLLTETDSEMVVKSGDAINLKVGEILVINKNMDKPSVLKVNCFTMEEQLRILEKI